MSGHTKGPWQVIEEPAYPSLVAVKMSNGEDAGYVAARSSSEEVANAHLIASAPELLDALRSAYEMLRLSGVRSEKIEAVIAKAEGKL